MSASYITMKIAGQQRKTTTGLSSKSKADSGLSCTKSGTSIRKTSRQGRKAKGNDVVSLKSEQSEQIKISCSAVNQGCFDELPHESLLSDGKYNVHVSGQSLPSPNQLLPLQVQIMGQKAAPGVSKLVPGKSPERSKKFKLQLFPIDKVTRKVLEKDKHNPYLELTLGTQKKISSVVNHLSMKWGNSKAASGELMLFPFNAQLENLCGHRRWTRKDSDTSAADVYAAVGCPAVFRLRYCWFSNLVPEVCAIPLTPVYSKGNLQNEENQNMNISDEKTHLLCEQSGQGHGPVSIDSLNQGAGTPVVSDALIQNKDDLRKCNGASLSWIDCLSNISFGALLSEASVAPNTSLGHPVPVEHNPSVQEIPNFDSFDAAVASYIAHQQAPNSSAQAPHSSIWDSEETCHAFPFQKITSGQEVTASSRDASFTSCSKNISSNFRRLHDIAELGSRVVQTQDNANEGPASGQQGPKGDACLDHKVDLQSELQDGATEESKAKKQRQAADSHNNSDHLGRMEIYQPVSLDPLEYVAPSSRQISGGDGIGLNGLIESSLDAFQNFSIF